MKDYTFEVDYREKPNDERDEHLFYDIIDTFRKEENNFASNSHKPLIILKENKKKFDDMVKLMDEYCKERKLKGKCVISYKQSKATFYIYTGCSYFEVDKGDGDNEYDMLKRIANNSDYFLVSIENNELVVEATCWYFS